MQHDGKYAFTCIVSEYVISTMCVVEEKIRRFLHRSLHSKLPSRFQLVGDSCFLLSGRGCFG